MRADILLAIAAMAAATFFTRFACAALIQNEALPAWLTRLLRHFPTAMLAALIAPALLAPQGAADFSPSNHYLMAGAVSAWAAYRRQPPAITMGSGMAVMLLLSRL